MFTIKLVDALLYLKLLVLEMKYLLFSLFTGYFDEALSDVRSAREFQPLHLEAIEWGIVKNPFIFTFSDQFSVIRLSYEDDKLLRFGGFQVFKVQWSIQCSASVENYGSCFHHLGLDICQSAEYNCHDSLQVLLREGIGHCLHLRQPLF